MPEAFAVVREAARRTLGMRHFDVQLIGGLALHEGKIAEMRTGEGKTLVATLPAYLNALPGKGVHVVTVNEYLAQRDSDWMGPVYRFLGHVGGRHPQRPDPCREEGGLRAPTSPTAPTTSSASITCATTSRSAARTRCSAALRLRHRRRGGLDPDRRGAHAADHFRPVGREQRALHPHQQADPAPARSQEVRRRARRLQRRREEQAGLPDRGRATRRSRNCWLAKGCWREGDSLYDAANIRLMHHLTAGLRAHALYKRDVEYIVKDGEIVIVDEFTGRTMPGRRWSDGLHQADRGQGRRQRPGGEPDGRLHHLPELFPHVRQAGRHDRHGRHGGLRVPADLRAGGRRHPDAPDDDPQGPCRTSST